MERSRGPGVRFPPPVLFIVAFLVGLWLDGALYRIRIVSAEPTPRPLIIAGGVLVLAGVLVALWGVLTFRRHRTPVVPVRPATALVQGGPYRFTRNPMYLGMTLGHLGAAAMLNAMWPIILLPMALALLFPLVIRKEEAHLWQTFGEEYAAYRSRVRRWL